MGNGNVNITITSGSIVRGIFFILLFIFLFLVRDIVLVVLAAVVIASALEPLTRWLTARKLSRVIAVVMVYLLLAAVAVGVFYSFVPLLLGDTVDFLRNVPQYLDSISLWNPLQEGNIAESKKTATNLSEGLRQSEEAVKGISSGGFSIERLLTDASKALSRVSEGFVQTLSFVFGGVLSLVLIVVISFYLAVQEDGVAAFLRVVTPIQHEAYVIDLWKRAQRKIGRWMQGQLLLAVLVGVLVYLGLTVLGVRNAILLAFLAAILETIPLFGPILSAIPAIMTAYADTGVATALLVLGLYVIIQQFENHLIYPLVVKKIVGVPPILVILALIIGAKLGGFLGILLSVPVATTLTEYFDDLQRLKAGARRA